MEAQDNEMCHHIYLFYIDADNTSVYKETEILKARPITAFRISSPATIKKPLKTASS